MPQDFETLPDEYELALDYTPRDYRDALRTAFALDHRVGRIVAATSEPMLGQMRLAWWRDMLATPIAQRPTGDAVLDSIGEHWAGREEALSKLVDGWEVLVASDHLSDGDLNGYARGRAAPAMVLFCGGDETRSQRIYCALARFAFADLATGLSNEKERDLAISYGNAVSGPNELLSRSARGIAVLEALALRSLRRGARPLMEGRGASLTALRAGIFGR